MNMNIGRFYGKIVDAASGKAVEFASVSVTQMRLDSATNKMKPKVLGGQLTESNGDFSIEGLPLFGEYTMRISAIGYDTLTMKVAFAFSMNMPRDKMMNAAEKDLGNIKVKSRTTLTGVTIEGSDPDVELKPDRRVYNVEKNDVVTGGTGEDVLKTIPSVTVDPDGNVTMRNAAPQIFVDGRPSTLSLDQIPADAIKSVEIITSPSAKYDASGGGGGIINVVLKKDRRTGYNGSVRAGIDTRGRFNGGADINLREGKFNFFLSGNVNQRKSIGTTHTERQNLFFTPLTNVYQDDKSLSNGFFGFGRGGVDWFIDNRNTLTLSGNYTHGKFTPLDDLTTQTDTLHTSDTASSRYLRHSETFRDFTNYGISLQYKHLFPKEGRELTADVNYNDAFSNGGGNYSTQYTDASGNPSQAELLQRNTSGGGTRIITGQTDMTNPITDKIKIDYGLRASIRTFTSDMDNFLYSYSNNEYELLPSLTTHYTYTDAVYAAYSIYNYAITKWSYQVGIRFESSDYRGELTQTGQKYRNLFPFSFFPSGSATYKPGEKNDFQFSTSRRINRPNFFQLMPFTDYSDSLNLSRGNPGLKPEFTYNFEVSWMHTFNKSSNVLVAAYYKQTNDVIARYTISEFDSVLDRDAIISTYANATSSRVMGMELSGKLAATKWLDVSPSLNGYNSLVDATNVETALKNELFTWSARLNISAKLPKNFTFTIMSDYSSKSAVSGAGSSRGSGGGGGGFMMGGMSFGGGGSTTAQGYTLPVYGVDLALRKEFLKNKAASLTLNVTDVLKTRKYVTHTSSAYFIQDTERIRDQQFFRLNFSYRFGKFDVSLFRRKNMNVNTDGMQGM